MTTERDSSITTGLTSGITTGTLTDMASDKVRENRLRRMASRQGLVLEKSKRRDPLALGFGTYGLRSLAGQIVAGDDSGQGLDLDQIEAHLTRRTDRLSDQQRETVAVADQPEGG